LSEAAQPTTRPHILFGIGVGPGDPELITVKAVHALRHCERILVPATEASGSGAGRAETIVLAACPDVAERIVRIPFSMADRTGVTKRRAASWQASADQAVASFDAGATTIGFATIGDPSVYSTFSYLASSVREKVADLRVEVIPGITAMQALAAASLTPLVEGRESLTLVPVTAGLAAVGAALEHADTVVAYKGGRQLADLLALVHDRGLDGVLGVNVGLPGQTITPLSEVKATSAPYFSTVLVAPRRTTTGGAL